MTPPTRASSTRVTSRTSTSGQEKNQTATGPLLRRGSHHVGSEALEAPMTRPRCPHRAEARSAKGGPLGKRLTDAWPVTAPASGRSSGRVAARRSSPGPGVRAPEPHSGDDSAVCVRGRGSRGRRRLDSYQAAQLRVHVRPGSSLTPFSPDRSPERRQHSHDDIAVRLPAAAFALLDPLARGEVATQSVAAPASRDLVLDPAGPTLGTRHDVLGRGAHEAGAELAAAPHTGMPVPLEDEGHACASVRFGRHGTEWSHDLPYRAFADSLDSSVPSVTLGRRR